MITEVWQKPKNAPSFFDIIVSMFVNALVDDSLLVLCVEVEFDLDWSSCMAELCVGPLTRLTLLGTGTAGPVSDIFRLPGLRGSG